MLVLAVLPSEVEANHINEKALWRILCYFPFGPLAQVQKIT
jgi:hypothetical protein